MGRLARLIIAAGLVATILLLHLVEIRPDSLAERNLLNGLHAPGFGLASVLTVLLLRGRFVATQVYPLSFLAMITLAVAAEALQSIGTRGPSLEDLGHDLIGAFGGLLLAAGVDRALVFRSAFKARLTLLLFAVPTLVFASWSLINNAYALIARAESFPSIASFERGWEARFYRSHLKTRLEAAAWPPESHDAHNRVLTLRLGKTRYAGLIMDVYPNWTGYETLNFNIRSDDGLYHDLVLRVHDKHHNQDWNDRFNLALTAMPYWQEVSIAIPDIAKSPASRVLDLTAISQIVIYKVNADGTERLVLDDFELR